MSKPVSLILLNWNTPLHTTNCIASLKQYCNEQLFDIIVVDNGSTDNSLALLKAQYPSLTYIENNENLGFAEGNNRGLLYSIEKDYTYSLLINTDTIVDEDIVARLMTHLDIHPKCAAVQPAIYWLHDKAKIWNGKGGFNRFLGTTPSDTTIPKPDIDNNYYEKAEWATGCCVLFRNEALLKAGLFNKKFFLYYEDVELSFRLRDFGYDVDYLPSCKMYHEAGVSAKINTSKKEGSVSPIIHYYISRNHVWFLRKYGKPYFYLINILYNSFHYIPLLVYLKIRGRNQKVKYLLKGLKEGFFTPKNLIWPRGN